MKSPYVGPRCLLDPWDFNYFDTFTEEESSKIAWSDHEAVIKYPEHCWIYDKALLARELGQEYFTTRPEVLEDMFVRPRVNLWGMGEDARVIRAKEKIPEIHDPVWTPIYLGSHLSFDILMEDGSPHGHVCFEGVKAGVGVFSHWIRRNKGIPESVRVLIDLLPNYTGILNVEIIDGFVIEAHLRGSLQFKDISSGLFETAVGRQSELDPFRQAYSYVVKVTENCRPLIENKPSLPPNVTSYSCVWDCGGWLSDQAQPENSYVIFFVNGFSLSECQKFGKLILQRTKLRRR